MSSKGKTVRRSAAALQRRAQKWQTKKAVKKSEALEQQRLKRERNQAAAAIFPNVMGIVAGQGYFPNIYKAELTAKALQNVPLYQSAKRATVLPLGETYLHNLMEKGKYNKALHVLNLGVPQRVLNSPSQSKRPLEIAVLNDQFALFKRLLEKGANPNFEVRQRVGNKFTFVPLLSAMIHLPYENLNLYIEEILKHNIDLHAENPQGDKALDVAIRLGKVSIAKLLIDAGTQVEKPNKNGFTSVLVAIANNKVDILEYMVEKGLVDMDKQTANGKLFPLKIATVNSSLDMLSYVLTHGVTNVNAQDNNGNTALHYAVLAKDFGKIQLLLSSGASKTIQNNQGQTPMSLAGTLEQAGNNRALLLLEAV